MKHGQLGRPGRRVSAFLPGRCYCWCTASSRRSAFLRSASPRRDDRPRHKGAAEPPPGLREQPECRSALVARKLRIVQVALPALVALDLRDRLPARD